MSKGLLISIEGPDGAGKTSVLKVLLPRLREVYPAQVITTREPGGVAIAGRGLDQDEVAWLNNYATDGHKPDLTLLFDVDSETGLARIAANGEREVNRLDLEKLDMHQRVRQGYLDLAEAEPERIKRIDASQTLEEVVEDTWEIIKSYL